MESIVVKTVMYPFTEFRLGIPSTSNDKLGDPHAASSHDSNQFPDCGATVFPSATRITFELCIGSLHHYSAYKNYWDTLAQSASC
jgi:hypothetical protein